MVGKIVLVVIVALAVWSQLAPTFIGGRDIYVVTRGTSMLPAIRSGGLVVVRKEQTYRVGAIAAYRSPLLHSVVLHRITAIKNGQYTFKGDNNRYPDPVPVTRSAILGEKWMYGHAAGVFLTNLRVPYVGAAVLALAGMWAFAGQGAPSRKRGQHRRR